MCSDVWIQMAMDGLMQAMLFQMIQHNIWMQTWTVMVIRCPAISQTVALVSMDFHRLNVMDAQTLIVMDGMMASTYSLKMTAFGRTLMGMVIQTK